MPTLVLKIFLAIVPHIFRFQNNLVEGLYSRSAIDFEVGAKYYLFQCAAPFCTC